MSDWNENREVVRQVRKVSRLPVDARHVMMVAAVAGFAAVRARRRRTPDDDGWRAPVCGGCWRWPCVLQTCFGHAWMTGSAASGGM